MNLSILKGRNVLQRAITLASVVWDINRHSRPSWLCFPIHAVFQGYHRFTDLQLPDFSMTFPEFLDMKTGLCTKKFLYRNSSLPLIFQHCIAQLFWGIIINLCYINMLNYKLGPQGVIATLLTYLPTYLLTNLQENSLSTTISHYFLTLSTFSLNLHSTAYY